MKLFGRRLECPSVCSVRNIPGYWSWWKSTHIFCGPQIERPRRKGGLLMRTRDERTIAGRIHSRIVSWTFMPSRRIGRSERAVSMFGGIAPGTTKDRKIQQRGIDCRFSVPRWNQRAGRGIPVSLALRCLCIAAVVGKHADDHCISSNGYPACISGMSNMDNVNAGAA